MKESAFARRYRSQAFKTYRFQEGLARRPFIRIASHIPGFWHLSVGPLRIWRDGRTFGWGWR